MRPVGFVIAFAMLLAGCGRESTGAIEERKEVPTNAPIQVQAEPQSAADAFALAAIPLYPEATLAGAGYAISPVQDGQRRMAATLHSSDDVAKVTKFYAKAMRVEPMKQGDKVQIVGKTANGSDAILFFEPADSGTKITVRGIVYVRS